MAKQPKIAQTDYTRGGRDISNTAIPLYQQSLNQLGDYMSNVQSRLDPYMDYANLANAATQSDFLRNYQRAMGQATAGNYAATSGGYSSLNQQGYSDQQRYYNDLAARMYSQGLNTASQLAGQEYQMLTGVPSIYNQAYQLGKDYSDTERYNKMASDINNNWWASALQNVGQLGGAVAGGIVGGPAGAVAGSQLGGGILGAVGSQFALDPSALRAVGGATPTQAEQQMGLYNQGINNYNIYSGLQNLFGGNQDNNSGNSNSSNSTTLGNTTFNIPKTGQQFKWPNY